MYSHFTVKTTEGEKYIIEGESLGAIKRAVREAKTKTEDVMFAVKDPETEEEFSIRAKDIAVLVR